MVFASKTTRVGMKNGKSRFLKVYSNLPDDVRREVIVVIDDKPYTWNAAAIEVSNETTLGEKILHKMQRMELL